MRAEALASPYPGVSRIHAHAGHDAVAGDVVWSPTKSLWWTGMTGVAVWWGPSTFNATTFAVFLVLSGFSLCLGHSLGMHRLLIHRSFQCPRWLENFLVWCGALVGMAGPTGMARTHDQRDWAQRQAACHTYFSHSENFWKDAWWQLHCDIRLHHPPRFVPDSGLAANPFHRWLDATWMAQQLVPALVLYAVGGWSFVVWGVCARVSVSVFGHWLIGHVAHRSGGMRYRVIDAGVQGYNVVLNQPLYGLTGLMTMGECWHNNHHAFPGSAKLGLHGGQLDPGWWVLRGLQMAGLAHALRLPADLSPRASVQDLSAASSSCLDSQAAQVTRL